MEQPTLLDAMSQLAAQRCDAILSEARKEAGAIRAAAEDEGRKRRQATLVDAREAMAGQVRQSRERTAAEAEKQALVMQEVVVDELLEKVDAQLARISERPEFGSALETLLQEALQDAASEQGETDTTGFVVLVPVAHARQCEEWLSGMGISGAEVKPEATLRDGVIVEDRSHTFRIVNTLAGRYARMREEARRLCLRRLFGERPTDGA